MNRYTGPTREQELAELAIDVEAAVREFEPRKDETKWSREHWARLCGIRSRLDKIVGIQIREDTHPGT